MRTFSYIQRYLSANWSWRQELNPQPADYKSAALPIELRQHGGNIYTSDQKNARAFFDLQAIMAKR
jgi:hypothetical protein